MVDWLDYNGYTMITKPAKEFVDSAGRRKIKGNMDIELAVDVMEMASSIDHAVIFSGDGDFRSLVEAVQKKGLRVTVVSTMRSQPPMIADELRRQADDFIELMDLKEMIQRSPGVQGVAPMEDAPILDDDGSDELPPDGLDDPQKEIA